MPKLTKPKPPFSAAVRNWSGSMVESTAGALTPRETPSPAVA
jgi:hypothetical protein